MKKYIVTFFLLFIFYVAWSQCDTLRYQKAIFQNVTVLNDVKYGTAEEWNIPYNDEDLYMDIYMPQGDTLSYRPLMIWAHPGGFLNGSKNVDDMVAFCDSFAKRGYVTASIDYRLGFNPTSESSAERAGYRAVQDMRAAVRFLKEHYQDYGIDTNYTFIGGSSAGALMVDQLVYLDQNEAPSSIGAGPGYPALGCLDCTGNNYQHAMDITAYVSLWGALEDSTWIQADETTPGLLIHGTADGTVPFAIGHPFGVPTMPETQGSRCISNQLSSLGIPHETYFVPGEDHEFYGADNGTFNNPPNAYWDTVFQLIETHFYNELPQDTFSIQGEAVVCANDTVTFTVPSAENLCWSVSNGTIISYQNNSVQMVFTQPGNVTIQARQYSKIMAYNGTTTKIITVVAPPTVNFQTAIQDLTVQFTPIPTGFVNYVWDFGDGESAGNMYPTHVYSSPGSYSVVLHVKDQNGCSARHQETVKVQTTGVGKEYQLTYRVFPNPSSDQVTIISSVPLQHILLYTSNGKLVKKIHFNGKNYTFTTKNLPKNAYLLKTIDQNGHTKENTLLLH